MSTTWLRSRTYGVGNLVLYNDAQFISLQNNNLNHIPPSSSTWWQGSQSITALQAGAGISVNPSVPSVPVVSTNLTVTGGTGINVSETSAGPNNRTWTVTSTGSGGVASVSAGPGLTNTGTTTNPVLENTGVYSVNAAPGGYLAQSGTATDVLLANNGVCALSSTGAGLAITGTPQLPVLANTGVTSVSTGTGLSGGGTGAVALVNTGVTSVATGVGSGLSGGGTGALALANTGVLSTNATPGVGLYLSGASTGDVVLNNYTWGYKPTATATTIRYPTSGGFLIPCVANFTVLGAGGGGGGGNSIDQAYPIGGGGGASGQFLTGTISCPVGSFFSMYVGTGGTGSAANSQNVRGNPGGYTYLQFNGATSTGNQVLIWYAYGGQGGRSPLDNYTGGDGGNANATLSLVSTVYGFGGGGGAMASFGPVYAGNPGVNFPTAIGSAPQTGGQGAPLANGGDGGSGGDGGTPTAALSTYSIAGGGGGGGPFGQLGLSYTQTGTSVPVQNFTVPAICGGGGGGGAAWNNGTLSTSNALAGGTGGDGSISIVFTSLNV